MGAVKRGTEQDTYYFTMKAEVSQINNYLTKKREQNEPNNVLENQHCQGFVIDIIIVQN